MRRPTNHPFNEMRRLMRRMHEAMQLQRRRPMAPSVAWRPPMDLQASDDAYIVRLDLPGVRREDVEAVAEDGVLHVRGETGMPGEMAEARRLRGERSLGRFARSVRLPSDAVMSEISATLADGVLTVRVGRRQAGGRVRIEIGQ